MCMRDIMCRKNDIESKFIMCASKQALISIRKQVLISIRNVPMKRAGMQNSLSSSVSMKQRYGEDTLTRNLTFMFSLRDVLSTTNLLNTTGLGTN